MVLASSAARMMVDSSNLVSVLLSFGSHVSYPQIDNCEI